MFSSSNQLATAIALLTASFLSSAAAQVRVQRPVVEEFLAVCPTAIFQPTELRQVLDSRGLIRKSESNSANQRSTVYVLKQTEGLGINIDSSTMADNRIERCIATGARTTNAEDIYEIKAALERDSRVGLLEGSVTQLAQNAWQGTFERHEAAGLVGFGATILAGGGATVLTLAR